MRVEGCEIAEQPEKEITSFIRANLCKYDVKMIRFRSI